MFIIDDILIPFLIGGALGASAVTGAHVVASFLDSDSLSSEVEMEYPDAFKLLIKKKNAVNVGIFDNNENVIEDNFELKAPKGVSDSLYVGQEIYI